MPLDSLRGILRCIAGMLSAKGEWRVKPWKKAAYYAAGALGALALAATMGAALTALTPYWAYGTALAAAGAALHTLGGTAAVCCAAAGAVGLFLMQTRLRPDEAEEPDGPLEPGSQPQPARRRPAHEKAPRHEKPKVTA